jgi:hypothetical protein
MSNAAILLAFQPLMARQTCRFFLFEATTIIYDLKWFMLKLGRPMDSRLILSLDALVLAGFILIRIGYGSFLTIVALADIFTIIGKAHWLAISIVFSCISLTHCLNIYWTQKYTSSFLNRLNTVDFEKLALAKSQ